MKKIAVAVLFILHAAIIYADDYKWDLVNALANNDYQKIETIIKDNVKSMSAAEKRLVMNFTLIYSSGETTLRTVDLLAGYNILPNSFDLYTAINRNQANNVIQLLMQKGAKPNGEILLLATEKQRFDLAKQFVLAGVNVNYQYQSGKNYSDGMTPLLYACKWNNFELTKLLVENGAKVNIKAADGSTALSIAQENENNAISFYLMEHGAIDTRNNIAPSSQNNGIANVLDNRVIDFKRGTYRLSSNTNSMKFTGNANSGSVSYANIRNNSVNNGIYRINGNTLTIVIENYTFVYKIDSNESFSGNGEIWVRTGN
jgi:ankyrin repeat protein